MKKRAIIITVLMSALMIILLSSCSVLCPCKKEKKTKEPEKVIAYSKWRGQYLMKELDASEYIDLLEGEINRLNTIQRVKN